MSFRKTGMIEEKCYLFKRILTMVNADDAMKFIDIIEERVKDKSKSNIFVICLNPVKLGCQLVEIIERLSKHHNFVRVRVAEIRLKIVEILKKYMLDVDSHQEMKFLLL
jgi:hypothetical protein